MPGPVALVGSGEYLPVMSDVEATLLAGRPPRYVQLPTAAAEEGPGAVARWVSLGIEQAERLGVEAVPVMALDRDSADDEELARLVDGAGLVYLSGGNPSYVATTLKDTAVWAAIVAAWQAGAALAGCSAGAIALTSWVPDIRRLESEAGDGLGVVPGLRVLPHFDRLSAWAPGMAESLAEATPPGETLVGVDEETAIVSDGEDFSTWRVLGRQSAWVYRDGVRLQHSAGDVISL